MGLLFVSFGWARGFVFVLVACLRFVLLFRLSFYVVVYIVFMRSSYRCCCCLRSSELKWQAV